MYTLLKKHSNISYHIDRDNNPGLKVVFAVRTLGVLAFGLYGNKFS